MDKNEKVIDFKNIYVSYDVKPVLENINIQINQGEHWAILGQNGSGKSTFIKLLSNDIYPNTKYKFSKKIFGKEIWSIFDLKKNFGIITNDLHNYIYDQGNFLTAYEVVLSGFYSSIGVFNHQDFTQEQHDRALEVLEFLEIMDIKDKKVQHMSTGQLRKCVIGRALVHKPKAFVLDEPTVGLDIKAQSSFIKIIRKLSKYATIILVTHHFEEVFPEIKNVALVYNNTIYKKGPKEEILNSKNISEVFECDITLACEDQRYYVKKID